MTVLDEAYRPGASGVDEPGREKPAVNTAGLEGAFADDKSANTLDATKAHPARRYNYWLGGKDNFAADRESGDAIEKVFPTIRLAARENRAFLQRSVQFLTREAGVRQFLDIGTGLPTANNTHEVAQAIAPESRIVYVDNDSLVLAHSRALLDSSPDGRTTYLHGDLNDPEAILKSVKSRKLMNDQEPIAVLLVAVLHFISGKHTIKPIVEELTKAIPSGSYLVASHVTFDFIDESSADAVVNTERAKGANMWARDRQEFSEIFTDLKILSPGIVPVSEWRPQETGQLPAAADTSIWAAVGRKP